MNRNTNAHFAELPNVDIQRSTFDRSFSHKFSGNVGDIIPIFYDEILPGDTVVMDTSKVIRFQTMLSPMMDNLYADFYWMFCPNRLVWDHWINLMGENTESAWTPATEYSVPTIIVPPPAGENDTPNNNKVGTILDYLGFPVAMDQQTGDIEINALPIRGYCKSMNDWFRSENLTDPINLYTGDASVTATTEDSFIDDLPHGGVPFKAGKFADYFVSALPSPQKGDPVTLNASFSFNETSLKVVNGGLNLPTAPVDYGPPTVLSYYVSGVKKYAYLSKLSHSGSPADVLRANINGSSDFDTYADAYNAGYSAEALKPKIENLIVPLRQGSLTGTTNFTVNDLRYAFQMQKLLERDARSGSRYIETIKAHFGVDSPDQRLQRVEYLGGNRVPIQVNQVANTAQSEQDFLGDLGAMSVTSDVHSDFTKSFTEHGMLFCFMVVRQDHTYSQMLPKFWKRRSRFDYYWPVFANIGEQPIMKSEIFGAVADTDNDTVFGYNEAYAEYRYMPNRVSGELRPYVPNGLFSWTLADDYETAPSLSDSWLREGVEQVDRVLAVTSQNANQFWADVYFNFKHTRPMPVYSVPGLIDHN